MAKREKEEKKYLGKFLRTRTEKAREAFILYNRNEGNIFEVEKFKLNAFFWC